MSAEDLFRICVKLFPELKPKMLGYNNMTLLDIQNLIRGHFHLIRNNAQKRPHYYLTLYAETNYIMKLVPSFSYDHIHEKLELFGDLPNRTQIVLRLLLQDETQNFLSNVSFYDYLNTNSTSVENKNNQTVANFNLPEREKNPTEILNKDEEQQFTCFVRNDSEERTFKNKPTEIITENLNFPTYSNTSVSDAKLIDATQDCLNIFEDLDFPRSYNDCKEATITKEDSNNYELPRDLFNFTASSPKLTTDNNNTENTNAIESKYIKPIEEYFHESVAVTTETASHLLQIGDHLAPITPKEIKNDQVETVEVKKEKLEINSCSSDTTIDWNYQDLAPYNVVDKIKEEAIVVNSGGESDVELIGEDSNAGVYQMEILEDTMPKKIVIKAPKGKRKIDESNTNQKVDEKLVNYLCGIFPDITRDYISTLCIDKVMNVETADQLTDIILQNSQMAPKRVKRSPSPEPQISTQEQFELITEILPDCDPDYIRRLCDEFEGNTRELRETVNELMETKRYPNIKEYQRRQQLSAQQKQYTSDFSVENFLKTIPDPESFFSKTTRLTNLDNNSSHYAIGILRNLFSKIQIRQIQATFQKHKHNFIASFNELANTPQNLLMRSNRKPIQLQMIDNIPLLQEIAYCINKTKIEKYLEEKKRIDEAELQAAKAQGLLENCDCCYSDDVLPRSIFKCNNGCSFCKECIIRSTEVAFGEGKLDFPCLSNCSSEFSLHTLQSALPPEFFSKVAQKKALAEVKSAGIEDLEMCPFCDFASIPPEGDKIFTCLNPECMKQSCRACKEPSHIPLRCDEVEKDADVQARVFIENKMTEALLRECYKCKKKFYKNEGCNMMTCICGAKMCYVCSQPVKDYKHFNGQGGDRHDLCPLFSDTNALHKEAILKTAEAAKAEVGGSLKIDPTQDINKFYKTKKSKKPPQNQDRVVIPNIRVPNDERDLMPNLNEMLMIRMLADLTYNRGNRRRRRYRDN